MDWWVAASNWIRAEIWLRHKDWDQELNTLPNTQTMIRSRPDPIRSPDAQQAYNMKYLHHVHVFSWFSVFRNNNQRKQIEERNSVRDLRNYCDFHCRKGQLFKGSNYIIFQNGLVF